MSWLDKHDGISKNTNRAARHLQWLDLLLSCAHEPQFALSGEGVKTASVSVAVGQQDAC